ncbi:similar to Saccharomyces cerevisiae YKL137W CMC1 Evolutionarily conserved copper-binding protein of the mitochondrial intermembrane space [Maudiozyma saulgeensis]|uniref:COX assembly mitochondrial protein n=1 Tax=Maudiozyma saulgeensis TaxID=1789683 RepID=A0A1X7QZH6_9SACH|nr:similar to Saccharomyces cerevisiae YKL137W CMC1 Evolutionarily conserved copper-binding protein of the mitochondrial intermembrane space [Kazachstania saulgeensis]
MSTEAKGQSSGSRLPIWALSPQEEKKARANLKDSAYKSCNEFVKAMADCAKAHGIKVFPACEQQRDKMKDCIIAFQTDKNLDNERDLIVLTKIAKLEKQLNETKANAK